MILLLDTSTAVCYLTLVIDDRHFDYSWQADRTLARNLLAYIEARLAEHRANLRNLEAIAVMKGPGSFTGLRIGATVANTLASELRIPIVGVTGETWQNDALELLQYGRSDKLILPDYGRPARITTPKK